MTENENHPKTRPPVLPGLEPFEPLRLTTGPLLPVCGPFRGHLVYLYSQIEKPRTRPRTTSEQNHMKKPGYDPRFSVFLAALEALRGPF